MKRCPECRRDYSDETLSFCLDDGTALLDGPAADAAKTVAFTKTKVFEGDATKIHPSAADSVDGPRSTSSAEYLVGEIRRHKLGVVLGFVAVLVVILGLGYGSRRLLQNPGGNDQAVHKLASASLRLQPLTASGNIWEAAISPDGKFLAYTKSVDGRTGLW